MSLPILLAHLFASWHVHDGIPSKYAAYITFLNIWMWDGKDKARFPMHQANLLLQMLKNEDRQIRAVAFTGIVFMVVRYGDMLPSAFVDSFNEFSEDEVFRDEIIEVQKFFITTITGVKMQKKLHDEFFDKMQKEQLVIRKKLGMTDDEDERMEIAEQGNKKMMSYVQKLNNMVQDGVDMNIATFAALSRLEFFQTLENWFTDFNIDHPDLQISADKRDMVSLLFGHAELCDLDKYALASVVDKISSADAIGKQVPLDVIEQIAHDKMAQHIEAERLRNAYRYTFQTLFRFFQFSPWSNQTVNPLRMGAFLTDYNILAPLFTDLFLWESSKLFIRNSFYSHPAAYLRSWMHRNGQTDEALELLAHCSKFLGDSTERLRCLLELEKRHPEDMRLVQETGLCLVQEKRYEEALQRFFHLEVTENYLRGSARAIAWCSLMTGNYLRAQRYYQKLMEWKGGPTWEDVLNAGHSAWLNGDPVAASMLYGRYLSMHEDDLSAFDNDRETLLELGFTADDITLMRDTISR